MDKPRSNTGDVVSGVVLAALGIFIMLHARAWEYLGPDGPGPGFFPVWYGFVMFALALVLIVTSLRRNEPAEDAKPVNWVEVGRALTGWGALAVSIALLKVLGFLVSFVLLALFVAAVMYRRPLPVALAVAVGSGVAFYLLFPFALNVALPAGVLGF